MKQLQQENNVLLQSPPGTGKTTRIPVALLNYFSGTILVLQPRRIAARVLAEFVAKSLNEEVGQTVGYHFRLEKRTSSQTRLIFITEGMLLQYLAHDPLLKAISVVVLDEFHERNIHSDVALSSLRTIQLNSLKCKVGPDRPLLKLLVMSATLETKGLDSYLGVSNIIKVEGQRYPLKRIFRKGSLENELRSILLDAKTKGDVLVFLPGKREILNAKNLLEDQEFNRKSFAISSSEIDRRELKICTLFGDMPIEEQRVSLAPDPNFRKVILSTNIAETSLTIEGVDCVIDSGLQRSARYNHWNGLTLLETKKISKASAIQRAGRSNRNAPGVCYHLYSEQEYNQFIEFELPEIHRGDLSQHVLQLLRLGLFKEICWFESPRDHAIEKTFKFLEGLGAVSDFNITHIGEHISKVSLPPRLARIAIESTKTSVENYVISVLVKLSESHLEQGQVEINSQFFQHSKAKNFESRELQLMSQIKSQLSQLSQTSNQTQKRSHSLDQHRQVESDKRAELKTNSSIAAVFLTGYVDRIGQYSKVDQNDFEYKLSGGGVAKIRREQVVGCPDFIIVLDAFEQSTAGTSFFRVTHFMKIEEADLWNHSALVTQNEIVFNLSKEVLEKSTSIFFGQLRLAQEKDFFTDDDLNLVGEIFLREFLSVKNLDFSSSSAALEYLSHRMNIEELKAQFIPLQKTVEELNLIEMVQTLQRPQQWLQLAFNGVISKKELEGHDWSKALLSECSSNEELKIMRHRDQYFPSFITLLSGKKLKINYEFDKPPWISARLQEFFGMSKLPKLGLRQEPLLVHLLAPNMRALQITGDLFSFWKTHYPSVRKELMRRYPRHKWPEDPLILTKI